MTAEAPLSAPAEGAAPGDVRVVVVVGTDHHPFDRAVAWAEQWLARQPASTRAFIQHGSSQPPTRAAGRPLVTHDQLEALLRSATVVLCHGGPATITEVRRAGRIPVVLPRDPVRGEHVDSHQQLFARRMGAAGLIRLCETQQDLERELDAAASAPETFTVDARGDADRVRESVVRVARVLAELVPARWSLTT